MRERDWLKCRQTHSHWSNSCFRSPLTLSTESESTREEITFKSHLFTFQILIGCIKFLSCFNYARDVPSVKCRRYMYSKTMKRRAMNREWEKLWPKDVSLSECQHIARIKQISKEDNAGGNERIHVKIVTDSCAHLYDAGTGENSVKASDYVLHGFLFQSWLKIDAKLQNNNNVPKSNNKPATKCVVLYTKWEGEREISRSQRASRK